ncbi:hypothetical protein V8E55_004049 [Tylopilus felleus]
MTVHASLPSVKRTPSLFSVSSELANIGQCVDKPTTFTHIEGPESCISRVAEAFGRNQWVHVACHGLPNREKPFESAFALSACHTTVGDGESPDEVIHLASVMQFAGFRWVIIRLDHRSDNLHVVALVLGTSQSQSLHRVRPVACDPPDDPTLKKGSSRQGEMR